jgi:hypothetical protein
MYSYETFIQLSFNMKKDVHKLDDAVIDNLNAVRRILQIPIIEKIKTTVIVKKESSVSEILKILNKERDLKLLRSRYFYIPEKEVENKNHFKIILIKDDFPTPE